MAENTPTQKLEQWRDIPGYEGIYQVSDLGNVRALDRLGKDGRRLPAKALTPCDDGKGYRAICIPYNGKYKSFFVHALVMAAFVGPRPEGCHVCHNNGIPSDNRLCNLRYDTPQANERDKDLHGTRPDLRGEKSGTSKITEDDARQILALNGTMSQYEIARQFGISRSQVAKILYGQRWPHLGGAEKVIPCYASGEKHPSRRLRVETG